MELIEIHNVLYFQISYYFTICQVDKPAPD